MKHLFLSFSCMLLFNPWAMADDNHPHSTDPDVVIELFAEQPQIVTPTGLAVDDRGRVFVAESHSHFRPDDYDGPAADRILILTDSDGDGKADKKAIFHEGFRYVMDLAFHPDGSLYVATRWNIHRMRDTDGDDKADEITRIVNLETKGDYPHNGISGLAFHLDGRLSFGLGENLGADYALVGSDGKRYTGGGEGGSTYEVHADGTNLHKVSTGWWNPFGMCVDAFDRVFGTDNDPGASPPCRLIQVIEGGDYGYEYRYGRTGLQSPHQLDRLESREPAHDLRHRRSPLLRYWPMNPTPSPKNIWADSSWRVGRIIASSITKSRSPLAGASSPRSGRC